MDASLHSAGLLDILEVPVRRQYERDMVVTEVVDTLKRNELLLDAPPHEEDESKEWYCLKVVTVSSTGLLRFSCRIEGKTRNGGSREKSVGIYAACHTCRGDKELSI